MVPIGIPAGTPVEPAGGTIGPGVLSLLPARGPRSTKFSSGQVAIAGGSRGLTGAVRMSSLAAIRAGAGYATVAVPADLEAVFEAAEPEVMSVGCPGRRRLPGPRLAEGGAAELRARRRRRPRARAWAGTRARSSSPATPPPRSRRRSWSTPTASTPSPASRALRRAPGADDPHPARGGAREAARPLLGRSGRRASPQPGRPHDGRRGRRPQGRRHDRHRRRAGRGQRALGTRAGDRRHRRRSLRDDRGDARPRARPLRRGLRGGSRPRARRPRGGAPPRCRRVGDRLGRDRLDPAPDWSRRSAVE